MRTLTDAAHAIHKARTDACAKGLAPVTAERAAVAAAPAYLKRRVQQGQELPRVEVLPGRRKKGEQLAGVLAHVLRTGTEGGEMMKEVFVELCEMLVPGWAREDM